MATLMHLSDLHFGAHDPAVCAAVQRLAARLPLSMLVVSGDLTQRATAAQFAQAAEFVESLGAPCTLVLPGNHDLPLYAWWLRWGRAYQRFDRHFAREQNVLRQCDGFYVVGLNTTRAWRHERGSLSAAQIDHAAQLLGGAPQAAWRIVASHHPLVAGGAADRSHRPHRADEAIRRWRDAGATMLLSGHAHDPGLLQPLPGFWVSRAGTAVSHRLRHGSPNSLVVLSQPTCPAAGAPQAAAPAARVAERYDFDASTGEFVRVERHDVAPC